MKARIPIISLLTLMLSFSLAWSAEREQVWQQYLSMDEQTALLKIVNQPQPEVGIPLNLEQMLVLMRTGFDHYAAAILPPTTSQVTEYAESNVKGLWFKPADANQDKVLLYFHGGGYVVGSPHTSAGISDFLAREASITCFSLDYPLAPENPYPAAVDNALEAYKMLLAKGIKPANIVMAGDSAGGGLVLACLLSIRDQQLPMPAGAYLLSPWTDLTLSQPSYQLKNADDIYITNEFLVAMVAMYANGQDLKSPLLSPLFADLRNLPPLLIQVGSFEVLLDDSLGIARNAALANVPVKLTVWPGYYHVFQMMPKDLQGARKALQDGAVFLNAVMDNNFLQ